MRTFHVTIHYHDHDASGPLPPTTLVNLDGRTLPVRDFADSPPNDLFPISFEQAEQRLSHLPRCFVEPDGSFTWAGTHPTPTTSHEGVRDAEEIVGMPDASQTRWQLDGNLYDRSDRLWFIDLKGTTDGFEPLDQFLNQILDGAKRSILFQWMHAAVFMDEAEFRRYFDA